ncbi:methylmalonyl-CoA epimerase [bacterium 3DAC]|nr:methylmalonyl-CoA epimerase [Dictyoglomota bacterium]UZN22931.1 methylmalonyl-CoA epimerase [bacterium 3DAC]
MKVDHIAIAVKSLDEATKVYSDLFGKGPDHFEEVEEQKVKTAIYYLGDVRIELLEPTSDDSPIAKFIEKRGEGLHHVAYKVDDLEAKLAELKEKGFRLIDEKPRVGAEGKLIAFVHPKSVVGVLTELTQDAKE